MHYVRIVLMALLMVLAPAHATPPTTVYRYDSRNYEDVFQNGFTSWGGNDNILEHLTGRSCANSATRNSAFISTSRSETYTRVYLDSRMMDAFRAQQAGEGTGDFYGYIYHIRADTNFYEAVSSYLSYVETYGEGSASLGAGALATYQSEWLAHRRISGSNIRGVTRIHRNGRTGEVSEQYIPNPGYVESATAGNPGPYRSARSLRQLLTTLVRLWPYATACMVRQRDADTRRRAVETEYDYLVYEYTLTQ